LHFSQSSQQSAEATTEYEIARKEIPCTVNPATSQARKLRGEKATEDGRQGASEQVSQEHDVEEEELKRVAECYDSQRKDRGGISRGRCRRKRQKSSEGERGEIDGRERSFSLQLCGSRNHAAVAGVLAAFSRFATFLIYKSASLPSCGCCVDQLFFF